MVRVANRGDPLLADSSLLDEHALFQILSLPSGAIQLFSNWGKSFVSGVNEGTPREPGGRILKAFVADQVWAEFFLAWDFSDATFTLQSSYSKNYIRVMPGTRWLRLHSPEKPVKGRDSDRAYFFRPISVTGAPVVDPKQVLPD
jgi:hypothetical protein